MCLASSLYNLLRKVIHTDAFNQTNIFLRVWRAASANPAEVVKENN